MYVALDHLKSNTHMDFGDLHQRAMQQLGEKEDFFWCSLNRAHHKKEIFFWQRRKGRFERWSATSQPFVASPWA
jgi:hypothetical protein